MANQKISGLPAAGALTGAELVEAVQGGMNVQTTTQDIANLGGGGGSWGSITGTLSNQTDLQAALNAKEDIANQADVTIANGVTALNMAAGDIQFLTITEAKVINSITNSFIGTVGFVIPGTFSVTFTTINATITGEYAAGEQNIIWVTCIDATGTPEYSIVYDNSLSSGGVQGITGDGVDNTDPENPVIDLSTYYQASEVDTLLGEKEFTKNALTEISDNYTLVLGDARKFIIADIATAKQLTVPPHSSVPLPIGVPIPVKRIGAGVLTFIQGSGVTINASAGVFTDAGAGQYNTLVQEEEDVWSLQNGLSSADLQAALGVPSMVVLANDYVNDNTTPDTLEDITGLAFSVISGFTYQFIFTIIYSANATTTGSRWDISVPSNSHLSFDVEWGNSLSARSNRLSNTAVGGGSANLQSPATSGNRAIIRGEITATANGSVQARCASEIAGPTGTITAKASVSRVEYKIIA